MVSKSESENMSKLRVLTDKLCCNSGSSEHILSNDECKVIVNEIIEALASEQLDIVNNNKGYICYQNILSKIKLILNKNL